MNHPAPLTIAYASRFGSTSRLATALAEPLTARGLEVQLLDVATAAAPQEGPLIVLSAVIWDRPLPEMRTWLEDHAAVVAARTVAAGVVCGSAGVRAGGGMVYARSLVKRTGASAAQPFALAGEIPARDRLRSWQWWALKAFSLAMRKPQLFSVRADLEGARAFAATLMGRLGP